MLLKVAKGIAIAAGLFFSCSALMLVLAFLVVLFVNGLAAALFVSPLLVWAGTLICGAATWSVVVTFMMMKGAK